MKASQTKRPILALAASLLASCGAGTAGIVASAGSGGGGTTPTITSFQVLTPKVSPATLRLEASESVVAELFFAHGDDGERPMMALTGPGVSGNQVQLPSGASDLSWSFAAATELGGPEFVPAVDLFVRHPNGAPISGGSLRLGMGNDPPVVLAVEPMPTDPANPAESSGNVEVRLGVSDSSSDVVAIHVKWRHASDAPDAWQPATAAGVFPGGVETNPDRVTLSFFWNTNVDLADGDDDVLLRVTADDGTLDTSGNPIGVSAPKVSALLHVDNNEEPIVFLDSGPLVVSSDERRGIPIPYRLVDAEGDLIDLVFQWRRPGEEFPLLPDDTTELDAILADPLRRSELHICSEYLTYARGVVLPVSDTSVQVPELAASEAWVLARGIQGRPLELLRPSTIPGPLSATWTENFLNGPVAALAVGSGLTAIVLDVPGSTGRLREIELATGKVLREIASLGQGVPTAMTYERGGAAVLVASQFGVAWSLDRIELAGGAVTTLMISDGSTEPPPVRGLASLGTKTVLLTAGSSLFQLDYRDLAATQLGVIRHDLATPWGLAVDPLAPNRVYAAEHDSGRILGIDLNTHDAVPIATNVAAPEALALEEDGTRLLVVDDRSGNEPMRLLGVPTAGGEPFAIGEPFSTAVVSVATGPEVLRLLALPEVDDLAVGGGIEQARIIASYSPATQRADLSDAFEPSPRPNQPWRIPTGGPVRARPDGLSNWFIWDSLDLRAGQVFFRVQPRDSELGSPAETGAPKTVLEPWERVPLTLGGFPTTFGPESMGAADFDLDGDIDLVSANRNSNDLTVFFQTSPRSFAANPLVLESSPSLDQPASLAVGDLDSDADIDIVSANEAGDNLTVFIQTSVGIFIPLVLGDPPIVGGFVDVGDFNCDGELDIVSGNIDLVVFLQTSPGSFSKGPTILEADTFPRSISCADLDSDGDLDVASANSFSFRPGNLSISFQASPGIFMVPRVVLESNPFSVESADLDGDGDSDLAFTHRALTSFGIANGLTVLLQDTRGSFDSQPLVLSTTGGPPLGPDSIAAADLDGDLDLDLLAPLDSSNLITFFQTAPGVFEPEPILLGNASITNFPSSVAAADIDGDGNLDIASANSGDSNLTVFFQNARGTPDPEPLVLGGRPTMDLPFSVSAADLDGDGDLDLASANTDSDNLTLFFQDATRSFDPVPLVLGGSPITDGIQSVAAADLDGDADLDVLSANPLSGNPTVFFQTDPGIFDRDPLMVGGLPATDNPRCAAAADLDGDGDNDIVTCLFRKLAVFFQTAPGRFDPKPLVLSLVLPAPPQPGIAQSVTAADLDNDGDLDLIAGLVGFHTFAVFFQTVPGSFDQEPLVIGGASILTAPQSIDVADLDRDGDLDLVCAAGQNMAVFFQTSSSGFSASRFPAAPLFSRSVATADLDDDGDLEIVSSNSDPSSFLASSITVFSQSLPGSFDPNPTILNVGIRDGMFAVATPDLDGDGEVDIVSSNAGSSDNLTIFWSGR